MSLEALGTFGDRSTVQTSTQPALPTVQTVPASTQLATRNVTLISDTNVKTALQSSVPASTQLSLQFADVDIAEFIDIKALLTDFPKTGTKQSLNMRVDAGTAQRVDQLAQRYGTTKTAIVERAITLLSAVLEESTQ